MRPPLRPLKHSLLLLPFVCVVLLMATIAMHRTIRVQYDGDHTYCVSTSSASLLGRVSFISYETPGRPDRGFYMNLSYRGVFSPRELATPLDSGDRYAQFHLPGFVVSIKGSWWNYTYTSLDLWVLLLAAAWPAWRGWRLMWPKQIINGGFPVGAAPAIPDALTPEHHP